MDFRRHLRIFLNTLNRWQNIGHLAKILQFLELHFVTAKISDFGPTLQNFSNYITSLLKSWICCQLSEIFQSYCITAEDNDLLPKPWIFLNYIASLLKSWFSAKILELLGSLRITSKILDFFTKAWIVLNYVASQLYSLISCLKLVSSWFTKYHF